MNNQKTTKIFPAFLAIASALLACNQLIKPPAPSTALAATAASVTETSTPDDPEAGSPGMGDSLYPDFGNGGYQVEHYTLDLTVHNVATSDMTGIVTIEAQALQDLTQFNLDFIGFEIASITVNNEDADFKRSGQELTIIPEVPLSRNANFIVGILYEGRQR